MTRARRLRAAALSAALLAAAVASGCGVGQNTISSPSVAGCFRALPTARTAIHETHARLLGVHRVRADHLPSRVRAGLPPEDDQTVCAVAFKGSFTSGQVTGALPGASGPVAVVLVDARRLTVIGSFVGQDLPRGLAGHLIV